MPPQPYPSKTGTLPQLFVGMAVCFGACHAAWADPPAVHERMIQQAAILVRHYRNASKALASVERHVALANETHETCASHLSTGGSIPAIKELANLYLTIESLQQNRSAIAPSLRDEWRRLHAEAAGHMGLGALDEGIYYWVARLKDPRALNTEEQYRHGLTMLPQEERDSLNWIMRELPVDPFAYFTYGRSLKTNEPEEINGLRVTHSFIDHPGVIAAFHHLYQNHQNALLAAAGSSPHPHAREFATEFQSVWLMPPIPLYKFDMSNSTISVPQNATALFSYEALGLEAIGKRLVPRPFGAMVAIGMHQAQFAATYKKWGLDVAEKVGAMAQSQHHFSKKHLEFIHFFLCEWVKSLIKEFEDDVELVDFQNDPRAAGYRAVAAYLTGIKSKKLRAYIRDALADEHMKHSSFPTRFRIQGNLNGAMNLLKEIICTLHESFGAERIRYRMSRDLSKGLME